MNSLERMNKSNKSKYQVHFQSLEVKNSIILMKNISRNSKISDGTLFCYQFFFSVMNSSIRNKDFTKKYDKLKIILKCIQYLKTNNKFNSYLFGKYLLEDFSELPIEIVWWLNKNEITSLVHFCTDTHYPDLADDLINTLKTNNQHPIFIANKIVEDILIELIRGCYRPYISVFRLTTSQCWSSYCISVINDLMEKALKVIFDESDEPFFNCLSFLRTYKSFLPNAIIKRFHLQMLHQLLQYNTKDFDLYSSYTYQESWCSKTLNKNLYIVYKELFMQICNLSDILNIIEEYEENVNWKYTLTAIGVCTKISATGPADVKEATLNLLTNSFKGGKVNKFIKGLLIIRQGCLEETMKMDYATWYSTTFGHNSNFKTTQIATIFNFHINTLTSLIPFEPLSYLKIHINCAIAAPHKCNYLVHDYKALCKSRVKELTNSPCIFLNGVSINVLYLMEECVRVNAASCMFRNSINQNDDLKNIIESPNLKQQPIYEKFTKLFLYNK